MVLIGVGLANSGLFLVVVGIGCCPGGMIEIRLIKVGSRFSVSPSNCKLRDVG